MSKLHLRVSMRRTGMLVVFLMLQMLMVNPIMVSAASYAVLYPAKDSQTLLPGTIVLSDSNNLVRPATQYEGKYVFGIAASLPKSVVSPGDVGVVSSGVTSVLVSNLGGNIKAGDPIAISPLGGVGMKAQAPGWIVGIAQTNFSAKSPQIASQVITDVSGKKVTVSIKEVSVLLSVAYYNPNQGVFGLPVQNMLDGLAGHSVPTDRAVMALFIFGVAIIALIAMVYGAVKHSLIAVGRNPMAYSIISRSLAKVLLTAVAVIVITPLIIYFVLR